jgi:hypothetical protein
MKSSVALTNEEIREHLLPKIESLPNVDLRLDFSDMEDRSIILDGAKEDCFIQFYPWQISVACLNENFLFIDDVVREKRITSGDTFGEIVYEGKLTGKSPAEILELIFKVVRLVYGAKHIEQEKVNTHIKTESGYDTKFAYNIRITNPLIRTVEVYPLENLAFYVNQGIS